MSAPEVQDISPIVAQVLYDCKLYVDTNAVDNVGIIIR